MYLYLKYTMFQSDSHLHNIFEHSLKIYFPFYCFAFSSPFKPETRINILFLFFCILQIQSQRWSTGSAQSQIARQQTQTKI